MAINPLYSQQASGSGKQTQKHDAVKFLKIGDKVIGVITEVGDAWDKPVPDSWIKEDTPEWKKTQKSQKVNLLTEAGPRSLYLQSRMFGAIGVALAEVGQDDLVGLEGWTLGMKLADVDLQNKNAKIWEARLVPPSTEYIKTDH